jgi:hypothetical protein
MSVPIVSNADAIADGIWFDQHPARRYRIRQSDRGTWIIRRRGSVLLRAFTPQPLQLRNSEAEIGPAWFAAAYPESLADRARRQARKAGVRRHG